MPVVSSQCKNSIWGCVLSVPRDLANDLATRGTELRAVGFLLEGGTGNARLRAVLDHCRHGEVLHTKVGVFGEVLSQNGVFTVAGSARQQISPGHVGRDHV